MICERGESRYHLPLAKGGGEGFQNEISNTKVIWCMNRFSTQKRESHDSPGRGRDRQGKGIFDLRSKSEGVKVRIFNCTHIAKCRGNFFLKFSLPKLLAKMYITNRNEDAPSKHFFSNHWLSIGRHSLTMLNRLSSFLRLGLKRVFEVLFGFEPPPENATTLLLGVGGDGEDVFLGSCFAYSSPHIFLTAAHCIRDRALSTLRIWGLPEDKLIQRVILHPKADLAVLITNPSRSDFTPYRQISEVEPGDEVHAYGFHEDTTDQGIEPLDRHFHGVVQRLFTWDILKPYSYDAIELSFDAPPGLSGGPLYKTFLLQNTGVTHYVLVGIVTGNREASIPLQTITEVQNGNKHYVERIHSVTNYGIALNLTAYTQWLSKICKRVERNKNRAAVSFPPPVTTA